MIVDIDASKVFVNMWVHIFVAIEDDGKGVFLDFDQMQTCLIFPLRWASFPIQISRSAQWEHLFSMYFDDFSTIYLIF